jgi:dihydrofolate synthase / folylpolyglutamate synthase
VLEKFLDAKPLYYDEIDYTRMPRVYDKIKEKLKLPKIIHLIGTNGKGTTGRFLATALQSMGYDVGHYTSPHIVEFNERIWLNGANTDYRRLESAHMQLLEILSEADAESLSYFEYTTLLAMLVYKDCEYVVLEAGLGGEHDATAVFPNILTLVTPIGKDHEAFLGDTIEKIAMTKLNAIQKTAILTKQVNQEVYDVANRIVTRNRVDIYESQAFLNKSDYKNIEEISKELRLSQYLEENLQLCIAALNYLKIKYTVDSFQNSRLFGRLSPLGENILIDVGHNVLAAQKIVESLKTKKYVLVYNSYKDKSYREILTILRPIIEHVEIIRVDDTRIESAELMKKTLVALGYEYHQFQKVHKDLDYLVFGSFSVVEAFLKAYRG